MVPYCLSSIKQPALVRQKPYAFLIGIPQKHGKIQAKRQHHRACKKTLLLFVRYGQKYGRNQKNICHIQIISDSGNLRHKRTKHIQNQGAQIQKKVKPNLLIHFYRIFVVYQRKRKHADTFCDIYQRSASRVENRIFIVRIKIKNNFS